MKLEFERSKLNEKVMLRVSPDIYKKVRAIAKKEKVKQSVIYRALIKLALEKL